MLAAERIIISRTQSDLRLRRGVSAHCWHNPGQAQRTTPRRRAACCTTSPLQLAARPAQPHVDEMRAQRPR
jgi:hypothetical protein